MKYDAKVKREMFVASRDWNQTGLWFTGQILDSKNRRFLATTIILYTVHVRVGLR